MGGIGEWREGGREGGTDGRIEGALEGGKEMDADMKEIVRVWRRDNIERIEQAATRLIRIGEIESAGLRIWYTVLL